MFLGFSAVSEEIDRHKLKRITLVEEQHTTLASRVQLKIRACQEECARLQAQILKSALYSAFYIVDVLKH